MAICDDRRNATTRAIETLFKKKFFDVDAYRYNSAAIRVRVIDPQFSGLLLDERDELVESVLGELSAEIQQQITLLLLLAPGEEQALMMNFEFENPSDSLL